MRKRQTSSQTSLVGALYRAYMHRTIFHCKINHLEMQGPSRKADTVSLCESVSRTDFFFSSEKKNSMDNGAMPEGYSRNARRLKKLRHPNFCDRSHNFT